MFMHRVRTGVALFCMAGIIAAPALLAAGLDKPAGTIVGVVSATNGVNQMGATVLLYNRFDRLVKTALTNEKGAFGFDGLIADHYSLKVSLSSFMPAFRQNVEVQAGNRTFLAIQLASAISTIELIYNAQAPTSLMSDDWKWVLRSSMSSRPALRLLPDWMGKPADERKTSVFSQTKGLLKLSAGEGTADSSRPDLGTAFALATSLLGTTHLQFSGNVGYASKLGTPAAGFRTRYSRTPSSVNGLGWPSPELQLTMRQVFLPAHAGIGVLSGRETPSFRTMSASFTDRAKLTDSIELLYGAALESVSYLERLNYFSPYARLSIAIDSNDSLQFAYSSGLPPEEIYTGSPARPEATTEKEMSKDVSALSAFPKVSARNGRAQIQRSENLEVGFQRKFGKGELAASAWHERVSNGAFMASGNTSILPSSDILPDLFSNSSIVNIGHWARQGYMASWTQHFGEWISATGGYGNSGTLQTEAIELSSADVNELRQSMRHGRRSWAYARVSASVPYAGTRITSSYQFTDYSALMPIHRSMTGSVSADPGFNIQMRQPIPSFGMWNGRVEAMAEVRNLLNQGYISVSTGDGRTLLLMQSPKTFRGGLSFIF